MKKNYITLILVFLAFCFAIFLTFNRHSKTTSFNYHSEIWVDKAGYYVYLPAALKYRFDPYRFPDSIDQKTGGGFWLDYKGNRIVTKYTYGVALMQLPAYLAADLLAKPLHFERDGFSRIYHWSINVSAVIYLILGLYFLGRFLSSQYRKPTVWAVLLVLFFGTNLYYYAIDDTGMSHIYSFALFSMWLFLARDSNFLTTGKLRSTIFLGIIGAMIILIRPTNMIFLPAWFFLDAKGWNEIGSRLRTLSKPRVLAPLLMSALVVFAPQMFYWHYAFGTYLSYSYGHEGFNWTNPWISQTWFSPNNGLFLYTPMWFVIIFAIGWMIARKKENGIFLLGMFITLSYVFASWYDWTFGCSFGARSFTEYLAVFSIPLAWVFNEVSKQTRTKIAGFALLVCLMVILNLKMIYSYDGCFNGARKGYWNTYFHIITSPTK